MSQDNVKIVKAAFRAFKRDGLDDAGRRTDPNIVIADAGERVIVRGHQSARGSASGAWVEADFWYVLTLSEGRIKQLDIYLSREQAIPAAGLSE